MSDDLDDDGGKAAERVRAYRLALGRFVEYFAKVELFVHFTLRHYTRTSLFAANALFSGVRVDAAQSLLRRLHEIGGISAGSWSDLEPVLAQLKIINDRRNAILHLGAEGIAEGEGHVTNDLIAHIEGRITTFPISPDILDDMTHDLGKILIHLYDRHTGNLLRPEGTFETVAAILHAAWRYKPPQQSRNRSRQDGTTLAPRRQRSPSPE